MTERQLVATALISATPFMAYWIGGAITLYLTGAV